MLPKKILVFRFSAMGDVLLLVPVLKSLTAAYPDLDITLVTRPRFASFFGNIPGIKVFEADVDYTYDGVFGLRDLFKALWRKGDFDLVIDMHDHIRTIILRTLFKLLGTKVIVFNKGRKEKKAFTRKNNKITTPLPHTIKRYQEVFEKAGFTFSLSTPPYMVADDATNKFVTEWLAGKNLFKKEKWVGIAPFAMHATKIWPVKNYPLVIQSLIDKEPFKFFLFGGGKKEVEFFYALRDQFPDHCVIVAEQMKIKHEIALMQHLDLMLCVDSSNMHLAAMSGAPLLSIWGGTHPDVGFGPFGRDNSSILQLSLEEVNCRPCSVYGRATCFRDDFACLTGISVDRVVKEIMERV